MREGGWAPAETSVQLSAVSLSCLTISSTGLDKDNRIADEFVRVDAGGSVTHGAGKPSV